MADDNKSVLDFFKEFLIRNKPTRYENRNIHASTDSDLAALLGINSYRSDRLIDEATQSNNYYVDRYREYESMEQDTTIQSALELYSDDATALTASAKTSVRVTSNSETLKKDIEYLLTRLRIDKHIWNWAYQMCLYGDHYVNIHFPEGAVYPKIFDYDDPACILDIQEYGDRLLYIEDRSVHSSIVRIDDSLSSDMSNQGTNILQPDDLVHFMISKSSNFSNISLTVNEETDEFGNSAIRDYQVVRGSSILEPVRHIYRLLRMLEDSLVAVRVSKSNYVRVFNIEVQDSIPKDTVNALNQVKNLFDSKASFNTNSGTYQSNKEMRPHMDPIFNPVRNGKGAIDIQEIGGEVEVSNIADIDYFSNKLYGGLKIPKAFLGVEESLGGGFSDNSLTHLDLRYSRSVSRVTRALSEGITDIVNQWLLHNDRSGEIGSFDISINSSSDSEILSSVSNLNEIFRGISDIVDTVSTSMGQYVNVPNLLKSLIQVYIPDPELLELIQKDLNNASQDYQDDIKTDTVVNDFNKEDVNTLDDTNRRFNDEELY